MITYVKKVFGHLDGIVNNAGIITRTYDWKNITLQDWNINIGTNLIGSWNVIRFGVDIMEKGGSIFLILLIRIIGIIKRCRPFWIWRGILYLIWGTPIKS